MVVCDICNASMSFEDGYALTTAQVVMQKEYWLYIIKKFGSIINEEVLNLYFQRQATQSTGWLVCESCSNMFTFDRTVAKEYARKQMNLPSSGPADMAKTAVCAADAWRELHGTGPFWVR